MPVGQPVEIAHPRPDPIVAGIDDSGNVDAGHGLTSALFSRSAFAGRPSLNGGWRSGRRGLDVAALAARGLLDPLHIARLSNEARHLREAPALHPDVRENGVD